jgi:hypothetical protein
MKIVSLTAENIKRLTAVHIKPNGALVEIKGENAQGKSSVLDAIWWAISGTANVQSQPIRKGEQRGTIKLDCGEIVITRTFTRKDETDYTTSLQVRGADGSSYKSPQSVLDALAGALSFDPLAFTRMRNREQYDALRPFVPGIDFEKVDAQNRGDFERRTEANRMAKQARAAADMIVVPADTPEEPIDEQLLTSQLEEAGKLNFDVERRTLLREQAARDVAKYRQDALDTVASIDVDAKLINDDRDAQLRGIESQIAALQLQLEHVKQSAGNRVTEMTKRREAASAEFSAKADALQAKIDEAPPLPAIIDTAQITASINAARAKNQNVERARLKALHSATAKSYETEAEQLTANIQARESAKRQAIAAAKMPVPGLDFGDGVVLLNGVPFDQASDAERLRASVGIAMAANPKLRVIRIRDGSLLDTNAMKLLEQIAIERDFQVWIERVGVDGPVGFVLEDGHVRDAAAAERSAA